MKNAATVLLVIIGVGASLFGLEYLGMVSTGFFAPRYEAIRRNTMVQSRAYAEANIRELYRLRAEYQKFPAGDARDSVRAMIVHHVRSGDRAYLPADLQGFIASLGE